MKIKELIKILEILDQDEYILIDDKLGNQENNKDIGIVRIKQGYVMY